MFKFVNKRLRNRKGFTLIELVVVIAILGILALIAIPRFAGIRENADLQAEETTATTILNAAELYYVNTGDWPAAADIKTAVVDEGLLREWPTDKTYTIGQGTTTGTYIVSGPSITVGN